MSDFQPEAHFLSYFHRYRVAVYRPDRIDLYEAGHAALKAGRNPDGEAAMVEFIDRHNLRDRAHPLDYDWPEWRRAFRRLRETGEETFPRDKGYETRGFTLSAYHQMKMHQFRPFVGLRYARLHEKLALDNQNDDIMGEIIELIETFDLRASRIPFGYDVDDMQRMADRLLRVNREKEMNGEL